MSQSSPQIRVPATYMRGGTSKGVFFSLADLPEATQLPGEARDRLMLRVIGSPDPYAKHTDGMGGATSSTSKVVILCKSKQAEHDVDYLFGQVSIDKAVVDWSGNCGNLSSAVGTFAINSGLIDRSRIPQNGLARLRVWQANIQKTIIVHVPICNGEVQEIGNFELDGVAFPAAEIQLEFIDPGAATGTLFPTGNVLDELDVPGIGKLNATLINAGIPTIFLNAAELGYSGTELQQDINGDAEALQRFESIRAQGAVRMGLIDTIEQAANRQHTPKVAFVAKPLDYVSSSGKQIDASGIDLLARAMSMGQLHHAMMGTAAIAIATAVAVPGTLVNQAAGGIIRNSVCFGHPSGTLRVGAEVSQVDGDWRADKAVMSRSARTLMDGWVHLPGDGL